MEHMTEVTGVQVLPTEMVLRGATPMYCQRVWHIHSDGASKALCTLPANSVVYGLDLWVQQAFNASGADDAISVGIAADHDSYMVAEAVVATGVKTPALGADAKVVVTASNPVLVYYTYTGDAPTTGAALVTIYYFVAPAIPA